MKNEKILIWGEDLEMQAQTKTGKKSWLISISTGLLLSILSLISQPIEAQEKDSTDKNDSTKIEKVATPVKNWSFTIDPTYSPTDKVATFRLSGWGSIHGIDAGWFLDLSWSDIKEWINSAFGKLTLSTSTDKIIKWSWVAVEYTLNSNAPDKIRSWILYKHKMANWGFIFKLYPVSDKWFEPFVLVWADQKLWKKIYTSAFVWSDIKSKTYYWEVEATYKVTKQIEALLQTRVWWDYTSKPKAWLYVGTRIKF